MVSSNKNQRDAKREAALKNIGRRVKMFRDYRGLKQKEVEARSGVSGSTITALENGTKDIGTSYFIKIASALGVDIIGQFTPGMETQVAPMTAADEQEVTEVQKAIRETILDGIVTGLEPRLTAISSELGAIQARIGLLERATVARGQAAKASDRPPKRSANR